MVVPHYPMLTALGLPRRNQYGPIEATDFIRSASGLF